MGERLGDKASPEAKASSVRMPARRRLQVYSYDPMLAQTMDRIGPATVTVGVPYEPLEPGPAGRRIQVIDFDGANVAGDGKPCFYEPVDLDDRLVALQDGFSPTEADPRFHQQMTYAVAARTLEAFDRGLGRRLRPRRGKLRIYPHAFRGRNAFYHQKLGALLFGYFEAVRQRQGANLPGQMIYTCLSHDIIAHETTHALVDRLRRGFMDCTNPDVAAFHEGFSDIVAIFSHFTLPSVLRDTIAHTRTQLANPSPLIDLAQQFGYATGRDGALRSAVDHPTADDYATIYESHDRGSVLVAAVFDAFLATYRRRIADLLRLATGGTGELPPGALHPDLVNRVDREATRTAGQYLNMCIRAFDYLPPIDVTFGDFLRAVVTGDRELYPDDSDGMRTALVDGFRRRGIYPAGVISLADDALAWEELEHQQDEHELELPLVKDWFWAHAKALDARVDTDPDEGDLEVARDDSSEIELGNGSDNSTREWPRKLAEFARTNAALLELDRDLPIQVAGFHPTFLPDGVGAVHVTFVVQFTQQSGASRNDPNSLLRRGTTVIGDSQGRVRCIVAKPLPTSDLSPSATDRAAEREHDFARYLNEWEYHNPMAPFRTRKAGSNPLRLNFAQLHGAWWR
jgi:hypothetical protein